MNEKNTNNWNNIDDILPEIGVEVIVKTVYGFEDIGIYDGTKWIGYDGGVKGELEEAPEWKLIK